MTPCPTGKLAHRTLRAANLHIRGMAIRWGEPVMPYRCRHCGAFHVGRSKVALTNPKRDAWQARMDKRARMTRRA